MEPNGIWQGMGISDADLEAKAEWISRDHPRFRGAMVMYFRTAASLIRFSRYDFSLLSLALLQAIIGLEKMLKLHYGDETTVFKTLLSNVVRDGVIADSSFSGIAVLPKEILKRIETGLATNAERFAALIPMLRNDFFHGIYLLDPVFLPLALQVREAVDAVLDARRSEETKRSAPGDRFGA